jgi:hypothetical protein
MLAGKNFEVESHHPDEIYAVRPNQICGFFCMIYGVETAHTIIGSEITFTP